MDDNVISGGHFEFYIFDGNRRSDVVIPAIFEISTFKYPLGQIFMLLSRCAHLGHISAPLNGFVQGIYTQKQYVISLVL